MKQILFLVLTIFLALSVSAQSKTREIDLKINGIGSGASYSAVIGKFGKPRRNKKEKVAASTSCSNEAETYLTLNYSGLIIELLGDGKGRDLTVYSIEITSPKWIITSGISIGASMEDIKAKFRQPDSESEYLGETTLYYVSKGNTGGVNFEFRNNKLVRVEMKETLC
jgi:hypothetical protein